MNGYVKYAVGSNSVSAVQCRQQITLPYRLGLQLLTRYFRRFVYYYISTYPQNSSPNTTMSPTSPSNYNNMSLWAISHNI